MYDRDVERYRELRPQNVDRSEDMGDLLREIARSTHSIAAMTRHRIKREDKAANHFAVDLFALPANGMYWTIDPEFYIGSIYVENRANVQCTVSVWPGSTIPPSPSFFDVDNGHYKCLPVNPKDNVKAASIKVTNGAGNIVAVGSILRIILMSWSSGPSQGTI